MRSWVKLLNIDFLTFEFDNCSFVIIYIAVIWSREYCDDYWKTLARIPLMHFITFKLCLVSSDHRKKIVFLEKFVDCFLTKEIRATSNLVCFKKLITIAIIILNRIRPQNITEKTCSRRFLHAFNFIQIFKSFEIWRDTSMNSEKFIIDKATDWQRVKCIHE